MPDMDEVVNVDLDPEEALRLLLETKRQEALDVIDKNADEDSEQPAAD